LILANMLAACSSEDPLERAKRLQIEGDFAGSVAVLRKAIEEGAADPELFLVYGVGLAETGNLDASVWPLRRALESPEWEVLAGLRLARGAFIAHSWDRSIEALDRVLELEPEHVSALVLRSRARIETRRDYEGALADAERALEINPDAEGARVSQVVSLLGLERADEAGELIQSIELSSREAGPAQPNTARFCGARASFALESGDPELADEIYSECLKEFPSAPTLIAEALKFYSSKGRLESSEGRLERTIEIYEAAVVAAPYNRDYRVGLAVRLQAQGREAEATATLRGATDAKNPALAAEAWVDLAGFLLDREDYDEAIEAFDQALELIVRPSVDLMFRYADALIISSRFDEAMEVADRSQVSAHRDLIRGRVHLERGQPALALESLSDSLKLWPDNAVARYYTSLAAEGVGDYERAIEEMRYSIRAGASLTDSRARLARLHMAEGQLTDALEVLSHDIVRQPGDVEMAVLGIELSARLALADQQMASLMSPLRTPEDWRLAILAGIRGTRTRMGPAGAVKLIHETPNLDLGDPANAPILERLVANLADMEETEQAVTLLDGYLEAQPAAGAFHAIRGLAIARRDGIEASNARKDWSRALELEPQNVVALIGLGRERSAAGEADAALAYLDKAIEAAPDDPAPIRAAIALLIAEQRPDEAQVKLERLLELEPYDDQAALQLLRMRVQLDLDKPRSVALAQLARRFGRGVNRAEANRLLKQLDAN
jgi:tetratricopeptide (TPR) repeat protein